MADPVVIWKVTGMDRRLPDGDTCPDGAVYAAGWSASYEKNGAVSGGYGSVYFDEPDPNTFVPYSDLTEEEVLNWIFGVLGEEKVQAIEGGLKQQVEDQLAPKTATGLPW